MTTLASGKRIAADAVFYSAGRQGATNDLGLDVVGLEATNADGSRSMEISARPCRTSMPPAT